MIFGFLKSLLFGEKEKTDCPVCDGKMEELSSPLNPYDVWFECPDCGAVSDGVRYWEDRREII